MIIHFSPVFNFIPAEYFTQMYQVTYQRQLLNGGMLTAINDKQIPQRLLRNTFTYLRSQLNPSLAYLYALSLQLKIRYFHLNTQPELAILEPHKAPAHSPDSWLKPVVIIEVLSSNDKRERKLNFYQNITSLREYVRIESKCYLIEHLVRQPGKEWKSSQIESWQDKIHLTSFDCHLILAAVYDKIET